MFVPRVEGPDLAWGCSGWPGARGFLLPPGGDRSPDFSLFPTVRYLTSPLNEDSPQGCSVYDFAPDQASSGLSGALVNRPPGKQHSACLGASGSQQKTKAPQSLLATVLWEGNGGPESCPFYPARLYPSSPLLSLIFFQNTWPSRETVPFQAIRPNQCCIPNLGL